MIGFFDVCTKNYAGGFITFLKPLAHLMKVPCGDEFLESTGKFCGSSQSLFFFSLFFRKKNTQKNTWIFGAEFKVSSHEVEKGVASTLWVSFFCEHFRVVITLPYDN